MASMLILSSIAIGANLTQEIMNNQTDQENRWIGSLLVNDKGQNGDCDKAATIFLFVVYLSLSFLLTAIILAIFANRRCRNREREQQEPIMVKTL